jgi:thiol-disulfide isomerase/thioredoxin
VIGLVVVVGVVAVILASGGSDSDSSGGSKRSIEIASSLDVSGSPLARYSDGAKDAAVGEPAPELSGVGFDGDPVTAGGKTGKPYALVFVAHWCPHCQAEVPRIVDLHEAGKTSGIEMIAIATGTDDSAQNYPPSAWLENEDWPFPALVDTASDSAAVAYGLSAYPFLVFVDANGDVAGRISGEVPSDQLQAIFEALAAGKTLPLGSGGASSSR